MRKHLFLGLASLSIAAAAYPEEPGEFIEAPKGKQPKKFTGVRLNDEWEKPKEKSAAFKKLLRGKGRK